MNTSLKYIRAMLVGVAVLLISPVLTAGAVQSIGEPSPGVVDILAVPNDRQYTDQQYLKQIQAESAWDQLREAPDLKIAIIDTGVDLEHPDLKENLIPGVNLIQPQLPPQDDNGHGTNVAGIIAAVANNDRGVSGLLWKAQLMPIKALDANGRGDEDKLVEAIHAALEREARIIVLSVGLLADNEALREAAELAERQGVLLVAASGNDEGEVVRYPAAYPSVLAVGGIRADNTVENRSNFGPEIDVVAPWSVFTTALGGRYESKEGTSMAAPQAAAVAALVWQKYPEMKPYEIRSLLRQTAQDVGAPGWDPHTGFGLIRADRALTEPFLADMYEPNDSRPAAAPFPLNRMVNAAFQTASDPDWYTINIPYDGTLILDLLQEADQADAAQEVSLRVESDNGRPARTFRLIAGEPLSVEVNKGRVDLQLTLAKPAWTAEVPYRLTSAFQMYRDPFEDNDRPYKAYVLPSGQTTVVGTFHQKGDEDWYQIDIERSGTLQLQLQTDSRRIDPVLYVQRKGEKPVTYDADGPGKPEMTPPLDVLPGSYYVRVTKDPDTPAVGEYTLTVTFSEKLVDPNEPNDKSYQATTIAMDYEYSGLFDYDQDTDWFQFQLTEDSFVDVSVKDVPVGRTLAMTLLNDSMNRLYSTANRWDEDRLGYQGMLKAGTYYIRLNADGRFVHQFYRLTVTGQPLAAGFYDIPNHWAKEAVVKLKERGVVEGNGTYRFEPEQLVSRAEAAAMIVRAFGYDRTGTFAFTDLRSEHWSYPYIDKAVRAGIVGGYPDGRFRPDEPVTRMEMAAMLARAMGLNGNLRGTVPFVDVKENDWGSPVLLQMKAEGWISGYADGTFRPSQTATRAEFSALLARMIQ